MDYENDHEVTRLQARVRELETELSVPGGPGRARRPPHDRRHRGRAVLSGFLIVVACLLAPLSVTAVWASTQISDTEEYVKTVAPLADDPEVQRAMADEVTRAILEYVEVEELTTELLEALAAQDNVPPAVAAAIPGLAVPLVNGVESFTRTQVESVLASEQFATLWAGINRVAHTQILTLLEGNEGGAVSAQADTVTLNLAPIIARVKEVLVAQGFTLAAKVPTVDRSFVLMQSDSVTKVQGLYRLLNTLGVWLPLLALALLAAGVFAAMDRRRALLRGSLGVVAAMLLLGVALAVVRTLYAQSNPGNVLTEEAAGSVFGTLVHYLRSGLRASAVLGLLVAAAAFLTGPSQTAVGTRSLLSKGISGLRGGAEAAGWRAGRVCGWTHAHRQALRTVLLIAGGLVLLFWTRPTVGVILVTAVLVVLLLGVIEFLASAPETADGVSPETQVPLVPDLPHQATVAAVRRDAPQPVGTDADPDV